MERPGAWFMRALGAGRGRPAALLLLVATAALLLPRDSPLEAARLALFDACRVYLPRGATGTSNNRGHRRAFVEGRPWRGRATGLPLIDRIAKEGPAAIGLDIIMPERDATSPEALARTLPRSQEALKKALTALPAHDSVLAAALGAAPVVLGAAGFEEATPATSRGLRVREMAVVGADPMPWVRRYPLVLASLPELQAAARGQALLSADTGAGSSGVYRSSARSATRWCRHCRWSCCASESARRRCRSKPARVASRR
jgi:hypothetical protein